MSDFLFKLASDFGKKDTVWLIIYIYLNKAPIKVVRVDATCSGYQHFSSLFRDLNIINFVGIKGYKSVREGAMLELINMGIDFNESPKNIISIDSDTGNTGSDNSFATSKEGLDIYTYFITIVILRMRGRDGSLFNKFLERGKITRDTFKSCVIILLYGAGDLKLKKTVFSHFKGTNIT